MLNGSPTTATTSPTDPPPTSLPPTSLSLPPAPPAFQNEVARIDAASHVGVHLYSTALATRSFGRAFDKSVVGRLAAPLPRLSITLTVTSSVPTMSCIRPTLQSDRVVGAKSGGGGKTGRGSSPDAHAGVSDPQLDVPGLRLEFDVDVESGVHVGAADNDEARTLHHRKGALSLQITGGFLAEGGKAHKVVGRLVAGDAALVMPQRADGPKQVLLAAYGVMLVAGAALAVYRARGSAPSSLSSSSSPDVSRG